MSVILPIGLVGSLVVLTRSFRQYGDSVKALTLAQWMGKRYDSTGLARWAEGQQQTLGAYDRPWR